MNDKAFDPEAFRRFEHDGWNKLHAGYHTHWAHLTSQVVPALLDAAGVGDGTVLLDVASGPGYVAGIAAERGARVTGLDFAANMVALAMANFPSASFQQGDAEALPFDDASFDAVTINFGVLHFPDTDKALAEAFRVLRPGGRIAFTNWAKTQRSALFISGKAVQTHGTLAVDLPPGTPPFRFAEPEECARTLDGIGFTDVTCATHDLVWRLPRPFDLMGAFMESGARTSGLLNAQDPAALPAIGAAMTEGCEAYVEGDEAQLPMPCVLTGARKP
ncbi:MAG: methyltransferase domain-containing protein [Alphaproteobacteria bacterium]